MRQSKTEPDGDCSENPNQSNDKQDVQKLYIFYYPKAVKIALGLGCSREDAEDLAQLAVRKGIIEGRCKYFDNFLAWLRRTIKRDYLNLIRRDKFVGPSLDEEVYGEGESEGIATIAETNPNFSINPHITVLDSIIRYEWYREANLTEREIRIIELRFRYDLPVREIADITGLTARRISKILEKAKAKLRQVMTPL